MLDLSTLALFTAAAAVLTATPGPDMLLIASRSLNGGVSHCPEEDSSPEDVTLAVDVLTAALKSLA